MQLISLIPRRGKVLFVDDIHLHRRNYQVLFNACHSLLYRIVIHRKHRTLKLAHGRYDKVKDNLAPYLSELNPLDQISLFQFKWKGIRLFPLVKAEMLSYLITRPNWISVDIPSDERFIFNKAHEENLDVLLDNLAAAYFWLIYWDNLLLRIKKLKLCVMFSGSLIYMKTLNYLLQNTPVTVFKTEHFFTGNAFYFEEKYTPIANLSDVSFSTYYRKLLAQWHGLSDEERADKINKAKQLYESGQNKNVKQSDSTIMDFSFDRAEKYVLIIGQVLNDFSILESQTNNLNIIRRYQALIDLLLNKTDYQIIFKAHPWERHKTHLKSPVTKMAIEDFLRERVSSEKQKRIHIVESININTLFEICTHIVGISSQGLLEAGFKYKKSVILGEAFFGKKGFTEAYLDEKGFVNALCQKEIESNLNEKAYADFLVFIALMFDVQLIQQNWTGWSLLRKKIKASQSCYIGCK